MDIAGIVNIILPIVFALVGVALIVLLIELVKVMKVARQKVEDLDTTLKNVEEMTTSVKPAVAKIDPLMDRVTLTMDSLNLEMMRVDKILEDVSEISGSASSATAAVDNITSAPVKAVASMADRVRHAFGSKDASQESAQLAEQRVAVAQALEEYKAAEEKDAKKQDEAPKQVAEHADGGAPQTYVKEPVDGEQPVIDPQVIAESPFFDEGPDAK